MAKQRWVLCVLVVVGACANTNERASIDDYVRDLGTIPNAAGQKMIGEPSARAPDGDFSCTTTSVWENREFDKVVAYSANSEAFWPGALVSGDSVVTGLLAQRVLPRAPMSFSLSLENLSGKRSAVLEKPRLSSYRDALATLLGSELEGSTAANIYAELEEVHSREQLELALGARAGWLLSSTQFSTSFNFENSDVRSRYLVKYVQAYYTVDADPPSRPTSYLGPEATLEEVRAQFADGDPPLYVSSITYGRMIVFTIESAVSSSELGAALEFAYRGGTEISGSVQLSHQEVLDRSRISAFILGGSAEDAARSIDSYESLRELIAGGGNYSRESPGAPIAYRLAYLADNSPGRLSTAHEYETRDCIRVNQKIQVILSGVEVDEAGDDGEALELYGSVWVESEGVSHSLFDRGSEFAVSIGETETWPEEGPANEAVLDVIPAEGSVINIGASLVDRDSGLFSTDDPLGDDGFVATFEGGWRRDVTLNLSTAGGASVRVHLVLRPI